MKTSRVQYASLHALHNGAYVPRLFVHEKCVDYCTTPFLKMENVWTSVRHHVLHEVLIRDSECTKHALLEGGGTLHQQRQGLGLHTCWARVGVEVEEGLLAAVALEREESHIRVPQVLVVCRLHGNAKELTRQLCTRTTAPLNKCKTVCMSEDGSPLVCCPLMLILHSWQVVEEGEYTKYHPDMPYMSVLVSFISCHAPTLKRPSRTSGSEK